MATKPKGPRKGKATPRGRLRAQARKSSYKGVDIQVTGRPDRLTLTIGDREVAVEHDAKSGNLATPFLPYTAYSSVDDLARSVIDSVPSFRRKTRS